MRGHAGIDVIARGVSRFRGVRAEAPNANRRPMPNRRHREPMVSADAFWSRGQDHEPHGCGATRRDAHRLLRHTLDLALAREILHADNVIARCNLRAVKMPTPPLDRAVPIVCPAATITSTSAKSHRGYARRHQGRCDNATTVDASGPLRASSIWASPTSLNRRRGIFFKAPSQ